MHMQRNIMAGPSIASHLANLGFFGTSTVTVQLRNAMIAVYWRTDLRHLALWVHLVNKYIYKLSINFEEIYIEVVVKSLLGEHIISKLTHRVYLIIQLLDYFVTFLFIECPKGDVGISSLTSCRCLRLPMTSWLIYQGFKGLLKASLTSLWWIESQIFFFSHQFLID